MSLLLRALKEAERDHLARRAGASAEPPREEPTLATASPSAPAAAPRAASAPFPTLDLVAQDEAVPAPPSPNLRAPAPESQPGWESGSILDASLDAEELPVDEDTADARAGSFPASAPQARVIATTNPPSQAGRVGAAVHPDATTPGPEPVAASSAPAGAGARKDAVPAGTGAQRRSRAALAGLVAFVAMGAAAWLALQYSGRDWTSLFASPPRPAVAAPTLLAGDPDPAAGPSAVAPSQGAHATTRAHAPGVPSTSPPRAGPAAPVVADATTAPARQIHAQGASSAGLQVPVAAAAAAAPAPAADHGAVPAPPAPGVHFEHPQDTNERVRSLLAGAYQASVRGDTAGARLQWEQALAIDRDNADAWIGLAVLAANAGDGVQAAHDYRRALEIDPTDSVALAGLLAVQPGVDLEEYEARLRQMIVRERGQPSLQAALGRLLAREGRWLDAQDAFFQAWSGDPTQPDVAYNLAVSLERIRQPSAAVGYYRKALELSAGRATHFDPARVQERILALSPRPTGSTD